MVIKSGTDEEKKKYERDILEVGGLLSFDMDGKTVFAPLTKWGFKDLADRAGVSCQKIGTRSLNRDKWLVENFTSKESTLVIRKVEENGEVMHKIFSVRGNIYAGQKQCQLVEAVQNTLEEDLGEAQCLHWEIGNEQCEITLAFPKKRDELKSFYPTLPDDVMPIVRIITSDVGKSSFFIMAGFSLPGYELFTKKGVVSMIHDKNFQPILI